MKNTPFRLLALSSILSFGAVIVLFTSVHTAQALTISPPSLEFGVQPGQQANLEIKLYNEDATQPIDVTTETTTWTSGAKPGEPNFQESATAEDIAKWITVDKGPIKLDAQGRTTVPVSVNVPADATPGGHYGAILFTFKNPNAAQNGQISITPKVATLFLVRVDGPNVVESGLIQSFGITGGSTSFQHLPVSFTTVIQNTGNIHIKPKGAITITNSFGKMVATIDFNTEKGATLPTTTRTYTNEIWQVGTVQPVTGSVWNQFWTGYHNERANFAIGKFTAKADLSGGTVKPFTMTASTAFWIIPWHIIIVYGVLAIIIIILLICLIRWYNGWIRRKATPKPTVPPQQ